MMLGLVDAHELDRIVQMLWPGTRRQNLLCVPRLRTQRPEQHGRSPARPQRIPFTAHAPAASALRNPASPNAPSSPRTDRRGIRWPTVTTKRSKCSASINRVLCSWPDGPTAVALIAALSCRSWRPIPSGRSPNSAADSMEGGYGEYHPEMGYLASVAL